MNKFIIGHLAALFIMTSAMAAESVGLGDIPPEHHHHHELGAAELPGDSLYQLQVTLETSDGVKLPLSELRGQPLLVTMFYSHCTSVCPLITAELQKVYRELTVKQRARIRVLMVSFDAQRDIPAELKVFEHEHSINDSRWIIARASADDVRLLAAVLGIRYRELPDHSFNHSAVISLADKDGVVQARAIGVQSVDASFMAKLRSVSGSSSANRPADE